MKLFSLLQPAHYCRRENGLSVPCLYPTQVGGLRQLPLYLRLLGFWVNTLQPAASFLLFMTTKNNRRGLWLRLSLALNARIRIARFKLWTYTTRALREQMFLIIILFTNILKRQCRCCCHNISVGVSSFNRYHDITWKFLMCLSYLCWEQLDPLALLHNVNHTPAFLFVATFTVAASILVVLPVMPIPVASFKDSSLSTIYCSLPSKCSR